MGINRQMINVSAAPIMTTKRNADYGGSNRGHTAQSWVAREKLSDALLVIALGDFDTVHSLPHPKRRFVVVNREFPGCDVITHLGQWLQHSNTNLLCKKRLHFVGRPRHGRARHSCARRGVS